VVPSACSLMCFDTDPGVQRLRCAPGQSLRPDTLMTLSDPHPHAPNGTLGMLIVHPPRSTSIP
jgi:hypothetical protein